jgi:hypothetical protein
MQTLRDVLLTTGLPVDRAISIVQRLRAIGALLIPGETAAPVAATTHSPAASAAKPVSANHITGRIPLAGPPHAPASAAKGTGPSPVRASTASGSSNLRRAANNQPPAPEIVDPDPEHDLTLPGATPVEIAALREDIVLDETSRRRILAMARLADGRDPWALLGVPVGADPRHLKRAYFKLSKDIHPDRYYGQRLGSFGARLPSVFEALSRAYARLISPDRPRPGDNDARGAAQIGRAEQPQTPQEYAAELFDRACQLEIGGDHLDAMKLFAAAVRVDSQPRYLRRAASCALAARQPKSAVEYAKKAYSLAPNDPSSARLLAAAFRAAGKLSDAEEVLVMAMALKSENDILTSELRNDLAEVRRLLAQ